MAVVSAYAAAICKVLSVMIGHWVALTAATPNIASWTAPQKCKIVGITFYVDAKSAITVLSLMAELDGVNLLTAVVDGSAGAVRTALAGTLSNTAGVACAKDSTVTLDVDTLTGTSATGIQMQIDWIPVD